MLVLRVMADKPWEVTELYRIRKPGRLEQSGLQDQLVKGFGAFTARVPVHGNGPAAAWFRIPGGTRWEAWLEPAEGLRAFSREISGDGGEILRYTGGAGTGLFDYAGGDRAVVQLLDRQFHHVQDLIESYGGPDSACFPGRLAWLAVQCTGPWTLTVTASPDLKKDRRAAPGAGGSDTG